MNIIISLILMAVPLSNAAILPFKRGDYVGIQCFYNNEWQAPPKCEETSEPIAIKFGIDTMLDCHIKVTDVNVIKDKLIKQPQFFQCRIAVSKYQDAWIPLAIPMLGSVASPSATEFTMQTKYNIVIHSSLHGTAKSGRIFGASVYPMMDSNSLQFARRGSRLSIHGAVRWFQRESFIGISSRSRDSNFLNSNNNTAGSTFSFFGSLLLIFLITTLGATVLYVFKLKPSLRRKYSKGL